MNKNLDDIIKEGCEYEFDSEHDLETKLITYLLDAMGWDKYSERKTQVPVDKGTGKETVDYIIGIENKGRFCLDAKNPKKPITQDDVNQISSYLKLFDKEDTHYGILYNGKKLWVVDRKGNVLYKWECNQSNDIFHYLSKDKFPEEFEHFLNNLSNIEKLNKYLSEHLNDLQIKLKTHLISLIRKEYNKDNKLDKKFLEENLEININVKKSSTLTKENNLNIESIYNIENTPYESRKIVPNIEESTEYENSDKNVFFKVRSRDELKSLPDGLVIVCPMVSKDVEDWGINFLKKYKVWEYIKIKESKKKEIKYIAFYVAAPQSKILYFAEVSGIVDASDQEFRNSHRLPPLRLDQKGKSTIILKENTLIELKDPIVSSPEGRKGIQGHIYTKLSKFIIAKTISDLTM
ncbi:MAG: type I restriction enzyme HsdR N-terminal domain-containing protein [Thermoplasmata archaeon]